MAEHYQQTSKINLEESENFSEIETEATDTNIDNEDVFDPKFTYDRIGNHFSEITEKDSATCLSLHERVCFVLTSIFLIILTFTLSS